MERWGADWWPAGWRALPAVGRVERAEVVGRVAGLVRGGAPVARAISRALSERRYCYADPADYVALVLELERRVRWALESVGVLPPPGAAPPPVVVRPLPGREVRRAAVGREVGRVLDRATTTGRSSGLSSGPRCRVPECGGQGVRLVALLRARPGEARGWVVPAESVAREDRGLVVDTEWRCAGHAPRSPVAVPAVGGAGGVRLVRRGRVVGP